MAGSKINIQDGLGNTSLIRMIEAKITFSVKILLSAGASMSIKNNVGDTALHHAIKNGTPEILKILLEHLSLDEATTTKILFDTIISMMKHSEDYSYYFNTYFESKFDFDDHLVTNIKVIKLLIECGANLSLVNSAGNGILHFLALKNIEGSLYELFEYLLAEKGLDPNVKNKFLQTPFLLVLRDCDVETCNLFLKHGARATAIDDLGRSAMYYAATQKHTEILYLLVKNRCSVSNVICGVLKGDIKHFNLNNLRFFLENGDETELKKSIRVSIPSLLNLLIKNFRFDWNIDIYSQAKLDESMRLILIYGADLDSLVDASGSNVFTHLERFSSVAWQILIQHVVLQQISGKSVNQSIILEVTRCPKYSSYFDDCLKEIEKMKNHGIDHFSLKDLLTESRERFRYRSFAKSKALYQVINKPNLNIAYPIYVAWIWEKYQMGMNFNTLCDNGVKMVSAILYPYWLPWIPHEKILSNLSLSDMNLMYSASIAKLKSNLLKRIEQLNLLSYKEQSDTAY